MRGKLIVIDGADGVGKATQFALLQKYLKKKGKKVLALDFPQYYTSFFGKMIGSFLRGEYGTLASVSPYLISIPYALDRASVSQKIKAHLKKGGWVLCNRYTPSSLSHQLAKVEPKLRKKLYSFIQELEYKQLKVVKEDMVIVLSLGTHNRKALLKKRGDRKYLKDKVDITEQDENHQETSSSMYAKLAKKNPHYKLITCQDKKGQLLSIEKIHDLVVQSLGHV